MPSKEKEERQATIPGSVTLRKPAYHLSTRLFTWPQAHVTGQVQGAETLRHWHSVLS